MSGHRRVISAESCASNLVLLAKPSDGPSHQGPGGHPAPPDQALPARSIQKTPSHPWLCLPKQDMPHVANLPTTLGDQAFPRHYAWHLATARCLLQVYPGPGKSSPGIWG